MLNAKTYLSTDTIDTVVYANTITSSLSSFSYGTGAGQSLLPRGIYSTDGGVTWNDCWTRGFNMSGKDPLAVVTIGCDSSGTFAFQVVTFNGSSAPASVTVNFLGLAIDSPSKIDDSFITSPDGSPRAYTAGNVAYRDIVKSNTISGIDDTTVHTIAHGQSGVPMLEIYTSYLNSLSGITPGSPLTTLSGGNLTGEFYVTEDSTNIYYYSLLNGYKVLYYRIYDEAS